MAKKLTDKQKIKKPMKFSTMYYIVMAVNIVFCLSCGEASLHWVGFIFTYYALATVIVLYLIPKYLDWRVNGRW